MDIIIAFKMQVSLFKKIPIKQKKKKAILEPVAKRESGKDMIIEMQLREDASESNLFIQPHLQSPNCLLSFQTWQTNKYTHSSINT